MRIITAIVVLLIVVACKKTEPKQEVVYEPETPTETTHFVANAPKETIEQPKLYTEYEQDLMRKGFLDIQKLDADILVNLGYATPNNFTGKQLYTRINHAFVHPRMAEKLVKAKAHLQKSNPNLTFLIFDALRPNAIQYKMWDAVKGTPKQKYVASPTTGSIHNYGLSVDLTIYDTVKGAELPMGTPIDYLGREAEYRYNGVLVQEGKITQQERLNRELLREVMVKAGFQPINSEWWHFNTYTAQKTKRDYQIVQ